MGDESTETGDIVGALAAVVAVATLPVGTLALFFVSFEVALVVFVVGWFLLTPLIPILGGELLPALGGESADADATDEGSDPLAELRNRYARGELGDEEFERQVEKLVATEGIEVDRDAVFDSGANGDLESNPNVEARSDRVEYDRE